MEINTASAVMSFARKLEESGMKEYDQMAKQYPENAEVFSFLAAENKRNIVQVERAYYGVISDALDGTFAFHMEDEDYYCIVAAKDYESTLKQLITAETKAAAFYLKAAEQSKGLLADVSRAFLWTSKKHNDRVTRLQEMSGN